jgi:hypothetical protein
MADAGGRDALLRLGARSVPVVARGDRFVFAQAIGDVAVFLGLDEQSGPLLSPAELAARCDHVLETAARLIREMPDERLETRLPNRPRSWRVLMHHVFQIAVAYLDLEERGVSLSYESLTLAPPTAMRTSAAIADFGEGVRRRLAGWWRHAADGDFARQVSTYFGETSRHEMFERTVWHAAQHTRQLAALLEQVGIVPDQPLTRDDLRGLPLTDRIWDEA